MINRDIVVSPRLTNLDYRVLDIITYLKKYGNMDDFFKRVTLATGKSKKKILKSLDRLALFGALVRHK